MIVAPNLALRVILKPRDLEHAFECTNSFLVLLLLLVDLTHLFVYQDSFSIIVRFFYEVAKVEEDVHGLVFLIYFLKEEC